jgi:hypothetical protein
VVTRHDLDDVTLGGDVTLVRVAFVSDATDLG